MVASFFCHFMDLGRGAPEKIRLLTFRSCHSRSTCGSIYEREESITCSRRALPARRGPSPPSKVLASDPAAGRIVQEKGDKVGVVHSVFTTFDEIHILPEPCTLSETKNMTAIGNLQR